MTISAEDAAARMRAHGYEPVGPYPGKARIPWPVTCVECGRPRRVALSQVGRTDCKHAVTMRVITPERAEQILRAAGYEPLEKYPGRIDLVWKTRCVGCGEERKPTLAKIFEGRKCKHRGVDSPMLTAEEARAVARVIRWAGTAGSDELKSALIKLEQMTGEEA